MVDDKDRPPLEHTVWVVEKICDHLFEGGTFRYLIYDRMGYGMNAYTPLYEAGGMAISNAFSELEDYRKNANKRGIIECEPVESSNKEK